MGFIIRIILTAIAAGAAAYLLPGVAISGIAAALVLALLLAVLNAIVRPILVVLTIPVTILTLGLFLLIINAIIILLADWLMGSSFEVANLLWAIIFSLVLAVFSYILEAIFGRT